MSQLIIPESLKLRTIRVFQAGHQVFFSLFKEHTLGHSGDYFTLDVTDQNDKVTTMCLTLENCAVQIQEPGQ